MSWESCELSRVNLVSCVSHVTPLSLLKKFHLLKRGAGDSINFPCYSNFSSVKFYSHFIFISGCLILHEWTTGCEHIIIFNCLSLAIIAACTHNKSIYFLVEKSFLKLSYFLEMHDGKKVGNMRMIKCTSR